MDLALTDDQQFFQETVRKFLEQETPTRTTRNWAEHPDGYDPAWWHQAAGLGFTSFLVSEADGGGNLSGRGLLDLAIIAEEIGRLAGPGPLVPANVVAGALSTLGSDEQRARLLPGILAGDTLVAWTGATGTVEARRDGADHVLTGSCAPVEAGAQAREVLITAETADGPTQFLVASDTPGFTATPLESFDLVRRFARIDLDGVRLGASAVLGELGRATPALTRQVHTAIVLQSAESVGALDVVLATTLEYLGDRYSFGRPLSSYQALKHRLADLKLWLEASHAITTLAANAVQDDTDDVDEIVHAAAAYIGDHSSELVHDAVQLHGGIGVTWEHDLHLYLRRVTVNRSISGTPAEHREKVAALSLQRLEER